MALPLDDGDDGRTAQPSAPSRRLLGGVALVSLAILLLQLTLTRLFSATMYYHFAFLAIALALFGSGASGVLVYVLEGRLRAVATSRALASCALLFAATTVVALAGSEDGNGGGIGRRGRSAIAAAGIVLVGLFAVGRASGLLEIRRAKGLDERGHILFEKWNSFSRVTVWGSLQDPAVVIMI